MAGGTFVWRGVVREDRPLYEHEVGLKSRGAHCRHAPGSRVPVWVDERTHALLRSIADRRRITIREALDLVLADILQPKRNP